MIDESYELPNNTGYECLLPQHPIDCIVVVETQEREHVPVKAPPRSVVNLDNVFDGSNGITNDRDQPGSLEFFSTGWARNEVNTQEKTLEVPIELVAEV